MPSGNPASRLPAGNGRAQPESPLSQSGGGAEAFAVVADPSGRRLDQWIAEAFAPDLSRSRAKDMILAGEVRVNGVTALSPKLLLRGGERVDVNLPEAEPAEPQPEAIPLDVLFEDNSLIVVNKPAGLVVHPGAGNPSGTLVNALLHHCGASLSGIGGVKRPGIVHRLDKDTSGVMLAAKTDRAHRALSESFADHGRTGDLERAYLALVWGAPERAGGTIDAPLGRDRSDPTKRAVVSASKPDARHAVTRFRTEERFGPRGGEALAAMVECRLETGRTHQIRVHMAHIGHPVMGDPDYGAGFRSKAQRLPEPARALAENFPRQALHARLLGFRHPESGAPLRFEAPLPAEMAELANAMRREN